MYSRPHVKIRDVRKAELLTLGQPSIRSRVYYLTVRGTGKIDGKATISLMLGAEVYRSEELNGTVDFEWKGDWYADCAAVRYEPKDVVSGTIVLHYHFRRTLTLSSSAMHRAGFKHTNRALTSNAPQ
jgi:hypothetical protein